MCAGGAVKIIFLPFFKFYFSWIRCYLFILWLSTWLDQTTSKMWNSEMRLTREEREPTFPGVWTGLVFHGSLRFVKPWRVVPMSEDASTFIPHVVYLREYQDVNLKALKWLWSNFPDRAWISCICCLCTTLLALKPILCFWVECSLNVSHANSNTTHCPGSGLH